MSTSNTFDAVIIGGGVIACSTALELSRRGLSTALVERESIAANASGFAWGGLAANYGAGVPGPMVKHYRRAIEMHRTIYEELLDSTSCDWGLQPIQCMTLAYDEDSLDAVRRDVEWMRSEALDAEMISGEDAVRLEPAIADGVIGASFVKCQWELDSLKFCLAVAEEARRLGTEVIKGEAVEVVSEESSRISGVRLADGALIGTSIVVAATGPWASGIKGIPELPIRPVKGEILRLIREGEDLRHRVACYGRNVGRKPDGTVWAGTYEWDRGFDRSVTEEGMNHIMNGVTKYLPSLEKAPLQTATACLRPVSSDGMPIVGAVGDAEGLYAANGAGKKGVLLSLLISQIIADIALEEKEPPSEMDPSRFG